MRYSKYFIPTQKEIPAEAEIMSHQLMIRAGMIRRLTSGIYTYLPIGLKSIRKVENIIREEMNRAGAIEILMPSVQPAELWQESGRWEYYGSELLRFLDRHKRKVCLGPTHEEVITDLIRREIHSYKQMPLNLYQIQTKFRDEIRPRFGIMRGREFIMKDAYSFDADEAGANHSYELMYDAYNRIFKRCGLRFRPVEADTGTIGGSYSHEFMVMAETGEDQIVNCLSCDYAANLERAEISPIDPEEKKQTPEMLLIKEIETPNVKTVTEVCSFLGIENKVLIKTLIYLADGKPVAILLRGDHELNEAKLKRHLGVQELNLADEDVIEEITGAPTGFAGPVGLKLDILADHAVKGMVNGVTGANKKDYHFMNVNLKKDFNVNAFSDLRVITSHDRCPRCGGKINFGRGIEVGHIFKLGTKYSHALNACYLDEAGKEKDIIMGCYGIGAGRTVAASIEQNHDKDGIIFPIPIAPFEVIILILQNHDKDVVAAAEKIYSDLLTNNIDVLLDDRKERAGSKFKDADLLGIPIRVTIGTKGVKNGEVEIKLRNEADRMTYPIDDASEIIREKIMRLYDTLK